MSSTQVSKLSLHPRDPAYAPRGLTQLQDALAALGLTGESFHRGGRSHYVTGEGFLELISFLGCSPAIQLRPPSGIPPAKAAREGFCHLSWLGPLDRPRLMVGQNTRAPRCPDCGCQVEDWQRWAKAGTGVQACARCGSPLDLAALDWRRGAGMARLFLEVWGVYPYEAVPSEALLRELRECSEQEWDYFYQQD